MALYCYIVETGYYEDREANILGHTEKYTHEEFDNLCIEITEKYGDVEEIEYFSAYDKTDVEEIRYKIDAEELMDHLINEYGFIELDIPVNDGVQHIEVSRKPCNPENIRKVEFKGRACPNGMISDMEITSMTPNPDFKGVPYHPNYRCSLAPIDISSGYEKEVREEAVKSILEWANKKVNYNKYYPRSKTVDDLLDNNSLNCSDRDRVPSNAEKIDEKTVRMKVKKD